MSLVLIKPINALASSSYNSGYPPNSAIDGVATSHWISSSKSGIQWISFDLGSNKNINGVNVYIIKQYAPTTIDIQMSNDNSNWTNILLDVSIVNGDGWTEIQFDVVDTRYIRFIMKSSASGLYLITEVDFLEAPVFVYNTMGEYTTQSIQLNGEYKIRWLEDKPEGTYITIQYTTGVTQGRWQEILNGDVVIIDTNLWMRVTLSTTDTSTTPTLQDLWIEDINAPQDKILITMDWWGRFNNVEDKIKVLYDASKGSLTGAGGAVESFEIEFTPENLVQTPNPNVQETIKAYPYAIIADLKEVDIINAHSQEFIKAYPYAIVLTLTDVGEVNP